MLASLIARQTQVSRPAAPQVTPGLSCEMVLQRAGSACLDHLACNEQAAGAGDAEAIHQIRVAVRRWRATLSALAPIMSKESRRRASDQLRGIADALSEARNLDVFASALLAPLRAAFPSSSELEHLATAIDRRRLIAHAAARTLIGSTRYRVAKRTLANWVDGCEWRAGGDVELLRRPIGELAPILLARCHRQIRKRGGSFSQLSEEERHRLRIDLKKLRYATELLSDLYEPAKAMGLIRLLKQLQDDLGDLNDVWLARDIVTNLVDPDAPDTGINHAGRRLIAWHTQRLAGNEPKLRRRLTQLLKSEPFWSAPPMLYVARNNPQSDP